MNRRVFLSNFFKLGVGAGVVAVYPAATLEFLERLFWKKKTQVVMVDWPMHPLTFDVIQKAMKLLQQEGIYWEDYTS